MIRQPGHTVRNFERSASALPPRLPLLGRAHYSTTVRAQVSVVGETPLDTRQEGHHVAPLIIAPF